jgi:fatty acid synthase, animal type
MVYDIIQELMEKGVIKPLKTTVFDASDVQNGFRFLATGKHIGKVLIKMREDENDLQSLPICVNKQIFFNESFSYVIVGGMGGFGLELADWMVLKGCKKLVMSSSRGVTNGYQKSRIR